MKLKRLRPPSTLILGSLLAFASAYAHAELGSDVLAKNRWTELTRADYDAALGRVPQERRYEFTTSAKRVQSLLNNLLLTKSLASQARARGTKPGSPFAHTSSGLELERELAKAELERIEADARASFDARKTDFEAKAHELYRLNPDNYRAPEEVRLSAVSVLIRDRGDEAALARAVEARAKIVAGRDFGDVAREYSDDRATRDKGGALPFVSRKGLSASYAEAVFALTTIGEVSKPIRTLKAYHVVRLEERRPSRLKTFDEVRASIMQELRTRYVAEQREQRIQAIFNDPQTEVNQAAVDELVNRVNPELFKLNPSAASSK
jgi:peptidyl-prolyl cis-trans isomerase C